MNIICSDLFISKLNNYKKKKTKRKVKQTNFSGNYNQIIENFIKQKKKTKKQEDFKKILIKKDNGIYENQEN